MAEHVNIHKAKTQLSELVARAEADEEIVIARANKPVAKLVPIVTPKTQRKLGEAKGLAEMAPDFDEMPDDFMRRFL